MIQLGNYYVSQLRLRSLLKGGFLSVDCWGPTTDTVIFEFYCDTGAGCDTDVQFWYRLTPSPVGAGEESLNEFLFVGLLRDLSVSTTFYICVEGVVASWFWYALLLIEWSGFEPWPAVDTLLSQYLSPPRCIYKRVLANLKLGLGATLQWTSIRSRGE